MPNHIVLLTRFQIEIVKLKQCMYHLCLHIYFIPLFFYGGSSYYSLEKECACYPPAFYEVDLRPTIFAGRIIWCFAKAY